MGVHGLLSFVEKRVPNGCIKVNILKLAQATQGDKYMIIDLLNVEECFNCSRDPPKHYFGNDYQRIRRIYADFIGKLKANGITPIFVEDGPQVASKHSTWVERKYQAMRKDMNPFFEALENGVNPDRHVEDRRAYNISEIIKDLGHQVFKSRNSIDADKSIAAFAEKYKAFAILANDADYLIFQYSYDIAFLSGNHLDFDTLDTVAYDRQNLVTFLKYSHSLRKPFKIEHLPALATLKGNDHFPYKTLLHFHDLRVWFKRPDRFPYRQSPDSFDVIPEIARYIAGHGDDLDLKQVSIDVFWRPGKEKALEESIKSYCITPKEIENPCGVSIVEEEIVDSDWNSLVQKASSRVGNLMAGGVYRSPALLEDYRGDSKHACHWGLPKAAKFYESLRERMYGILLFEKPNALNETKTEFKIQVTEYCLTGPGSLDRSMKLVPILPPNNNHPGLKVLWEGMEDRKYRRQTDDDQNCEIRWELFSYIINPKADPELFKNVAKDDLIMVAKLYHMQNERQIPLLYEYEVKAFILTHLKVNQKDDYDLKIFVPEPRATQLTTIYKFRILNLINATVGYVVPKLDFHFHKNFDGQLFHNFLRNFRNGTQIVRDSDLELFNHYFDLITFHGQKVFGKKKTKKEEFEDVTKSFFDLTMIEDPWEDHMNYDVSSRPLYSVYE